MSNRSDMAAVFSARTKGRCINVQDGFGTDLLKGRQQTIQYNHPLHEDAECPRV